MEAALRLAVRAGIEAATFWRLTPYNARLLVEERGKARFRDCVTTGWFAARFEREHGLKPLGEYLTEGQATEVNEAEALKEWVRANDRKFKRLANS